MNQSNAAENGDSPTPPAGPDPRRISILLDVWLLGHLTDSLLDGALAGSGLTADDFGLYSVLRGWAPITPGRLAGITGMRQNTVSAALQRLDRRGHLVREPNPDDARSTLISLSQSGTDAHTRASQEFLNVARNVDSDLGSTRTATREALADLDSTLRTLTSADPRPYAPPRANEPESWTLILPAPRLNLDQQREVARFAEWVAHRNA